MRILLSEALELPISSKDKMFFEKMGMDSSKISELTQKSLIQIGLVNKAKKGDAGAYKLIADILGENSTDVEGVTYVYNKIFNNKITKENNIDFDFNITQV